MDDTVRKAVQLWKLGFRPAKTLLFSVVGFFSSHFLSQSKTGKTQQTLES